MKHPFAIGMTRPKVSDLYGSPLVTGDNGKPGVIIMGTAFLKPYYRKDMWDYWATTESYTVIAPDELM